MKDLKSLIAELRAKANAATPGPWRHEASRGYHRAVWAPFPEGSRSREEIPEGGIHVNCSYGDDAAFIAACDPQTILRLCDELEAATKLIKDVVDDAHDAANCIQCMKDGNDTDDTFARLRATRHTLKNFAIAAEKFLTPK